MRVSAPSFGLIFSVATCHACGATTRVGRIWVPEHWQTFEPGDEPELEVDPALLSFASNLPVAAMEQIREHAPWMRLAPTRTSGMTYLANHCDCGAVLGDHYLGEPGEAFWPETPEALQTLRFRPCEGPLEAEASPGCSAWMAKVPGLARPG